MKSIKEISEEIGVSKQAVFKKIKREPLSTSLQGLTTTVDGRLMVSVDGELLIKQAFSSNDRQPTGNQIVNQVDGASTKTINQFTGELAENDAVLSVLKATIETLQGQLRSKDEQIQSLTSELAKEREHSREVSDKLAVLADQSQKLQLAQMQPQLGGGTIEEAPAEKKTVWQRFFGKG